MDQQDSDATPDQAVRLLDSEKENDAGSAQPTTACINPRPKYYTAMMDLQSLRDYLPESVLVGAI